MKVRKIKMERLNTIQKREKLNEVFAIDKIGNGNGYHKYAIESTEEESQELGHNVAIQFQNGARNLEDSTWGVIDTDLLEIVRHRLQCFQKGQFATEYNAKALEHIELALMYMNRRVEDRIERNVLGTNNK
jgi:hypothetical protein